VNLYKSILAGAQLLVAVILSFGFVLGIPALALWLCQTHEWATVILFIIWGVGLFATVFMDGYVDGWP
jgi:hypothetical protein